MNFGRLGALIGLFAIAMVLWFVALFALTEEHSTYVTKSLFPLPSLAYEKYAMADRVFVLLSAMQFVCYAALLSVKRFPTRFSVTLVCSAHLIAVAVYYVIAGTWG